MKQGRFEMHRALAVTYHSNSLTSVFSVESLLRYKVSGGIGRR